MRGDGELRIARVCAGGSRGCSRMVSIVLSKDGQALPGDKKMGPEDDVPETLARDRYAYSRCAFLPAPRLVPERIEAVVQFLLIGREFIRFLLQSIGLCGKSVVLGLQFFHFLFQPIESRNLGN